MTASTRRLAPRRAPPSSASRTTARNSTRRTRSVSARTRASSSCRGGTETAAARGMYFCCLPLCFMRFAGFLRNSSIIFHRLALFPSSIPYPPTRSICSRTTARLVSLPLPSSAQVLSPARGRGKGRRRRQDAQGVEGRVRGRVPQHALADRGRRCHRHCLQDCARPHALARRRLGLVLLVRHGERASPGIYLSVHREGRAESGLPQVRRAELCQESRGRRHSIVGAFGRDERVQARDRLGHRGVQARHGADPGDVQGGH